MLVAGLILISEEGGQQLSNLPDVPKCQPLQAGLPSTCDIVYLDILEPVMGIRSDGFSQLLATIPIQNRRAQTVMAVVHDILSQEMGIPSRVIVDWESEFTVDTRALVESQ